MVRRHQHGPGRGNGYGRGAWWLQVTAPLRNPHVISWTEQVAVAVGAALDAIGKRPEITGGELWFEGTLSPLARRSFEAQKWAVHEKVATRLDLA